MEYLISLNPYLGRAVRACAALWLTLFVLLPALGYCQDPYRSPKRPEVYLGIASRPALVKADLGKGFGWQSGERVTEVDAKSVAERAGLQRDDVIVIWDGYKLGDGREVPDLMRFVQAGRIIPIQVVRNGRLLSLTIDFAGGNERDEASSDFDWSKVVDNENAGQESNTTIYEDPERRRRAPTPSLGNLEPYKSREKPIGAVLPKDDPVQ